MNSLIITSFVTFINAFKAKFTESRLWHIINTVYNTISRWWRESVVMAFAEGGKATVAGSKIARVLYLPFDILEFIAKKLHKTVSKGIEDSIICELGRQYVHNFMALNTRFWGVMLLSATVVFEAMHIVFGRGLNIYIAVLAAVGAILTVMNYNFTGFCTGSKVMEFIKACAGVSDITFDFYDENKTVGGLRLIPAAAVGIITGVVMISVPLYGVLIPFAAFGMLLVLEYPITGVYAAVFVAPLIPFSSMPLAGICLWTMMSLVIKSVCDEDFRWKRDGLGAALIAFVLVLFISCLFSFARTQSLIVWCMYFIFITFYFAIINTIETRTQLYGLLRLFVISGTLVALYGVMQYAFGWTTTNAWIDEEMFEDDTMRVFSTLANPNVLGEYLLLVLPVSAVFFLKDKAKSLSKWVYLAMTGLIFLCLILTQSRGCWLGFMLTVAIFVTFYEGRWWALIPLLMCIIPFIIPQTIVDRLASVGNMDDSSTSYRVYIWMGAIGILRHYIAGGIGMGEAAFNEVYPFFSYNAITAPHSHNTFLQLLVESGIPALVAFLAVVVIYLRNTRLIYREQDKKSVDSAMSLALAAGVCGFLFQSLFDYTFYNYRVMAVFFMVPAMTMCYRYIRRK
ncbi:MAG: O-antigen ligase family protein [Clostridia bacterium]|nr:O-antigen ligase family protein [Clostridia bacterium]